MTFDLTLVSPAVFGARPARGGADEAGERLQGVRTEHGVWRGRPFVSVGAVGCELEFQRYHPRRALTQALAGCDLVQVVTGLPAPAYAACGLGKPVAVHCATRASVERKARHAMLGGPGEVWRRMMTRMIDRIDRKALEQADAIQVMNPWMLEYAREVNAGRDKPICLIQPGVDTARFVPCAGRDVRTQPYILCVGRLGDPRKNVGLLLQAAARWRRRWRRPSGPSSPAIPLRATGSGARWIVSGCATA